RQRRAGTDRLEQINESFREAVLSKSFAEEPWQKRSRAQPYTRYALGAMQPVDGDYTRISLETAQRVGKQLQTTLTAQGYSIAFRLQGSVPLDVHIRGVSDVDLLTLDDSFLTYHASGQMTQQGRYSATNRTSVGVLSSLRQAAERALVSAYPAATVNV